MDIELRDIDESNWFQCVSLKVSEEQKEFVATNYYVGNGISCSVMQKCGMRYEGRRLKEVKIKGVYFDVEHYAILKDEWLHQRRV